MSSLLLLAAGLCTTVQDLGRPGLGSLGVACAGAADALSLRVANRLVGNPDDAPALELTLTGGRFRLEGPVRLALAGAPMPCVARAPGRAPRTLEPARAHDLEAGVELAIGAATRGARAYLACAGGIDVPEVLGSRSTYLAGEFGGLGGRALFADDRVEVRPAVRWSAPGALAREAAAEIDGWRDTPHVRVTDGVHTGRFDDAAVAAFLAGTCVVSARSDRMGVRLAGPVPAPPGEGRLASEPLPVGTIEVPSAGHALVLLCEAPPTGGYAAVATVATVDLPRAAQWRPGERVRFERVTPEAARALLRERARRLDALLPPA